MKKFIEELDMLYINIGIIALAVFVIFISITLYSIKSYRRKKECLNVFRALSSYYESRDIEGKDKLETYFATFEFILARAYSALATFFRYQVITKVFGVTSCVLSAVVFIEPGKLSEQIGNRLAAVISMICVITLVYINPLDRAREYLDVWHMWNEYAAETIDALSNSLDDCEKKMLEYHEKVAQEREMLKTDKF